MAPGSSPEFATPTLLRAARGAYAQSIRAHLHAAGIDDLPRNGVLLLAEIGPDGSAPVDLPAGLGVTKQAVSQLLEVLERRGYLRRDANAQDRRRLDLHLTDRGQLVIEAGLRGIQAVNAELADRVSHEQVEAMRSVLDALSHIKVQAQHSGRGRRRQRQLRKFSPIFPVRDLAAAIAHYRSLGFVSFAYEEGHGYGFANRDGVSIHLEAHTGHDPAGPSGAVYLDVSDADALYAEWTQPGIGGRTLPVGLMEYGMREGTHIDIDGNVIRFGSQIDEGAADADAEG